MNVLVTGVSGFVGRNVASMLSKKFSVFGLVRRRVSVECYPILVEHPERRDDDFYRRLFEKYDISAVVHSGAITGERFKSWKEYYLTNVIWTKNLVRGFSKANVDRNLFVFVSSVGVYGTNPKDPPAKESDKLNPDGKYHRSKVLAEIVVRETDVPSLILRPTIMYGNHDRGFVAKVFRYVRMGILPVWRNPKIHLLDVEGLGKVCVNAIERRITGTFNLCDDEPLELADLLGFVRDNVGGGWLKLPICSLSKLPVFGVKFKLLCYDWYYDGSKAKRTFGSFGDTLTNLKKYIGWYAKKP